MTLKELSQLFYLNREIENDKGELAKLEYRIGARSQNLDGMPHSHGTTRSEVEQLAAEMADLSAIIASKQIQCIHERQRLERFIAEIPDSQTRQIFHYRFADGLTWAQVAVRIGGRNTEDSVKKQCYRYLDSQNS